MKKRDARYITEQIVRAIQHELGLQSDKDLAELRSKVFSIVDAYCVAESLKEAVLADKATIKAISYHSRKLALALAELPFRPIIIDRLMHASGLLRGLDPIHGHEIDLALDKAWDAIRQFLETAAGKTEHFLRYGVPISSGIHGVPSQRRKRFERALIWEPIFELWARYGQRVGFTENGPLMRVLVAFHTHLGLPPPSENAVRYAIRDFQKQVA